MKKGYGCSVGDRFSLPPPLRRGGEYLQVQSSVHSMTTEIRNWAVIAEAMEAQGATSSQMYIRAKALAEGLPDPMPTSFPAAPHTISAVL